MAVLIGGKTITQWGAESPEIYDLIHYQGTLWINPNRKPAEAAVAECALKAQNIEKAEERMKRFAPLIMEAFPETEKAHGIIESPLRSLPALERALNKKWGTAFSGRLLAKCDSHLPISGSIKARGGIYEVLAFAESLALKSGLLHKSDDYSILLGNKFRNLFSQYAIAAGSTGNLGLSIGIMGAKLGFHTTIHMSADARQWKKDLLRSKGVTVVEYQDDYEKAVEEGRKMASPHCHFVDDENSKELFLGYSTAAKRLKKQLGERKIAVDAEHPLFVYLPCGIGGGPGGVTFGLKQIFGDHVHCFFAEPTHSPCMMLGQITGLHSNVSVRDFGLDNKTAADGLAVGRPSKFVGKLIRPFLDGCYTVSDEDLYDRLHTLADFEGLWLEPSALAGFLGVDMLAGTKRGRAYLSTFSGSALKEATHIAWATGGGMVPAAIMKEYYKQGKTNLEM